MMDTWAGRDEELVCPTSIHQEMLFVPVNRSLLHFTQDIKAPVNPSMLKI
jgi:hypothetical protein